MIELFMFLSLVSFIAIVLNERRREKTIENLKFIQERILGITDSFGDLAIYKGDPTEAVYASLCSIIWVIDTFIKLLEEKNI